MWTWNPTGRDCSKRVNTWFGLIKTTGWGSGGTIAETGICDCGNIIFCRGTWDLLIYLFSIVLTSGFIDSG